MSSVGVDMGVMWRLSEDFNRRFGVRIPHQPLTTHLTAHHHSHPNQTRFFYNGD